MRTGLLVVVVLSGCVSLPVISAREVVARAEQNELEAAAGTRRTKVEVSGLVMEISGGQSDRLVTAVDEGLATTTKSVLRKPFVTFEVEGVQVLASLTDEDPDAALSLRKGQVGTLLCRFGHFDRNAAGQRVMVLQYCRPP